VDVKKISHRNITAMRETRSTPVVTLSWWPLRFQTAGWRHSWRWWRQCEHVIHVAFDRLDPRAMWLIHFRFTDVYW